MASALLAAVILIHSTPLDEIIVSSTGDNASKQQQEEQPLSLQGGKTIAVTHFIFSGNQAIPTSQLQRLVTPYLNRSLSQEDINAIKQRIALFYQSKGYSQVKVMIPVNQESGALTVNITEGKKG